MNHPTRWENYGRKREAAGFDLGAKVVSAVQLGHKPSLYE
jgi:hypothetical protein